MGSKNTGRNRLVDAVCSSQPERQHDDVAKQRNVASKLQSTSELTLGPVPGRRVERMYLKLPLSKVVIECVTISIDPDECKVSNFIYRHQGLLRATDPQVKSLMRSILKNGQREPILVRPMPAGSPQKYEVLYGSRRRFAVSELNKRGGEKLSLRAWFCSSVPDIDARILARAENEMRVDISPWENAIYVSTYLAENPTGQLILEEELGVDSCAISMLLMLSTLPEAVVRMMVSPNALTFEGGYQLAKAFRDLNEDQQDRILKALSVQQPFNTTAQIRRAFRNESEMLLSGKPGVCAKNDKIVIEGKDGAQIIITRHRTEGNRYIMDITGFDEGRLTKLIESLKEALQIF
ncbi:MAG: ParB/RepB/Spo0J family partition protein [Pseudohongiella sp.]|nr:ParB/RepB/Spo0J family partition protein [Pseudohongiella sp.]